MRHIKKIIAEKEKLLSITRVHWACLGQGLLWLFALSGLGFALEYLLYHYAGFMAPHFNVDWGRFYFTERHTPIPWIFTGAGLAAFAPMFLLYISTRIVLTNERIIYKRGLILVRIEQTDLNDISAETVNHGWLGWLFNYGRIHFDCRMVDDVDIPAVPDPYGLIKATHIARENHPDIAYDQKELQDNIKALESLEHTMRASTKLATLGKKILSSFRKVS